MHHFSINCNWLLVSYWAACGDKHSSAGSKVDRCSRSLFFLLHLPISAHCDPLVSLSLPVSLPAFYVLLSEAFFTAWWYQMEQIIDCAGTSGDHQVCEVELLPECEIKIRIVWFSVSNYLMHCGLCSWAGAHCCIHECWLSININWNKSN